MSDAIVKQFHNKVHEKFNEFCLAEYARLMARQNDLSMEIRKSTAALEEVNSKINSFSTKDMEEAFYLEHKGYDHRAAPYKN